MSFARIRTIGTWFSVSVVLPAEFEAFDTNISRAVDGYAGGTYSPSSPIVIGGDGLRVTGDFTVTSNASFTSALDVAGLLTANGLAVTGDALIGNDFEVTADSTLAATTINGALNTYGNVTIALGSTKTFSVTASGSGSMSVSAPSTWTKALTMSTKGTIVWRLNNLTDADTTLGVGDGDVHRLPRVTTGSRTYTLDDSDAVEGSRVIFSRIYSSAHTGAAVVSANAGSLLINISDATGEYLWAELIYDGTDWLIASLPSANP